MIERDSPVTTDELHAYVDGVLPPDRTGAVEAWLATHADDAARVAEWRAMSEAVRQRYGSIADEPVPARFDLDKLTRVRAHWRAIAAAAILALVIGGAAGWAGRAASTPALSASEIMTAEALSAHKLYIAEVRHPIEVKAVEKHLIPWLSKRVGTTLRIPDLHEYSLQLLGGRLLPGPIGPAALFMYENPAGERFTIYCSKSKKLRTALRYQSGDGDVAAMYWVESEIGYVLSGPADRNRLAKIAQSAYEQMETPPARGAESPLISRRKGS